jgi:hypothetical protein
MNPSPSLASWQKEVDAELRQLHRRKQALNQLIRAIEEYALVGGAQSADNAVQVLLNAVPRHAPIPAGNEQANRTALKRLLA